MRATLAALLILAPSFAPANGATEGGQDAGRIDALIRDLGADELNVRDEAARELFKIGEPAIPALERAIQETRSEELKGRASSLVTSIHRELRRRTFAGGTVVGDLAARVTVDEKEGRIEITVEIMNVGTRPLSFVPVRSVNVEAPVQGIMRTSSAGGYTVKILKGDTKRMGAVEACGRGPDLTPDLLQSGESRTHTLVMRTQAADEERGLRPGEYQVQFTYFAVQKQLIPGAKEDVVSNVAKFEVRK